MVDRDKGNLGSKVFFVWGSTCFLGLLFVYFCVPETKGLSLEQVDHMLEETKPRTSKDWAPQSNLATDKGFSVTRKYAGRKEAQDQEGEVM